MQAHQSEPMGTTLRRRVAVLILLVMGVQMPLTAAASAPPPLPPPHLPPPPPPLTWSKPKSSGPQPRTYLPAMPGPGEQVYDPDAPSTSTDESTSVKRLFELTAKTRDAKLEAAPTAKLLDAAPISQDEVERIFARVTPLKLPSKVSLNLPEPIKPPALPQKQVNLPFPPTTEPIAAPVSKAVDRSPLRVVRYSPEGELRAESNQVAITFSQPMVPLSSITESRGSRPPFIKLVPEPEGRWRWVDTRTLLFEPLKKQFPLATVYSVTVPAGVKSAIGNALPKAVTWSFQTAAPQVVDFQPQELAHSLRPHMVAMFSQPLNKQAAIKKVSLIAKSGGRSKSVPVSLLTDEEVKKDAYLSMVISDKSNRYLMFKPTLALSPGTEVEVKLGAGIPGASGSRTMSQSESKTFKIYPRLEAYTLEPMEPTASVTVSFTNNLDARLFKPSMVQIRPSIPGAKITQSGSEISISGAKKFGVKYSVVLSRALTDVYGQKLITDEPVPFTVRRFVPSMYGSYDRSRAFTLAPGQTNFSLFTINYSSVRVKLYKVEPSGWTNGVGLSPAQKPVWSSTLRIQSPPDQVAETKVNLKPFLQTGHGQFVLHAEPAPQKDTPYKEVLSLWLQSTNLAVRALKDSRQQQVMVTALDTGRPVAGATVKAGKISAVTDAHGVAVLKGVSACSIIQATLGSDSAYALGYRATYCDPEQTKESEQLWYCFSDRGLYRPGEEVHLKACSRTLAGAPLAGLTVPKAGTTAKVKVRSTGGVEFFKGDVKLDRFGAFEVSFRLPENAQTGDCPVSINDWENWGVLSVEEFRRPEFSVALEDVDASTPHLLGATPPVVQVSAQYLAGGALNGAAVSWNATGTAGTFTPAGWSEYEFQPNDRDGYASEQITAALGFTGITGKSALELRLAALAVPRPVTVAVSANVDDVNRQRFCASTSVLIHPSKKYVGLRCDRWFVKAGESIDVKAVCVDIDGKTEPSSIKLQTVLMPPDAGGAPNSLTESIVAEQLIDSRSEPVTVPVKFQKAGQYLIRATVTDAEGRQNLAEHHLHVFPGETDTSYYSPVGAEPTVELSADKTSYQDGDVAHIAVRSPFEAAEGIMTIARGGIVSSQPFSVKGGMGYVDIPIKDVYVPGITADFYLVESAKGANALPERWWTRRVSSQIAIAVPPLKRKLQVEVKPDNAITTPGANAAVDVLVRGADGKPQSGSQVTLVVVDESVLMLSNYTLKDPLPVFYTARPSQAQSQDSTDGIQFVRADSGRKNMESQRHVSKRKGDDEAASSLPAPSLPPPPLPGGTADGYAAAPPPPPPPMIESSPPIAVRSNFDPLAVFETKTVTDEKGGARVSFKLPDSLTRYRVMAFAISGATNFGTGESGITARLPLALRQSPPRFLNLGDKCELSFVLQNQTEQDRKVSVALRGSSSALTAGVGKQVSLAAGERGELRFPLSAEDAGKAAFQSVCVSGDFADAQEFAFPVYTPATTETFATYGTMDQIHELMTQPFKPPSDIFTQIGGLDVSTSSTALQELTDAVVYLKGYSFECSEQLSSRIIVLATLKDVLSAFKIPGTSPAELDACVAGGLKTLLSRQAESGWFGYWTPDSFDYPYVSVYAAQALATCSKKGYAVERRVLDRCKNYLRRIDSHIPNTYDEETKEEVEAYALYVRKLFGDDVQSQARKLLGKKALSKRSPEFLARMLVVALDSKALATQVEEIERLLNNSLNVTASTADSRWSAEGGRCWLFQSPVRTTGLVLDALIQSSPENIVIPKLVKGLLASRKRGAWSNTQDNAIASIALDRYFRAYEKNTPQFTARTWFGDLYLGDSQFRGRTTETRTLSMPTESLYRRWEKEQPLIISKEGQGRLYYRLGFTYAPRNLKVARLDQGFDVSRTYEAVESPSDIRRDDSGVWHVKPGALVRVRVKMNTPADRFHVALVDPLPAGFEPLNPELAGTQAVVDASDDSDMSRCWWYRPQWYEYTNLRDQRAEAFTGYLPEGTHSFSYVARATTVGTFIAPPPKAEEMYEPETFGRGNSEVVIVE
ncbi:MAG: Ig-like domain-containing protein [Candidatus Obscuribacterales bacterium]|nr:Ig-like domain-containing protein [Candidatus Obscuribacterales bacterium]